MLLQRTDGLVCQAAQTGWVSSCYYTGFHVKLYLLQQLLAASQTGNAIGFRQLLCATLWQHCQVQLTDIVNVLCCLVPDSYRLDSGAGDRDKLFCVHSAVEAQQSDPATALPSHASPAGSWQSADSLDADRHHATLKQFPQPPAAQWNQLPISRVFKMVSIKQNKHNIESNSGY